MSYYLVYMFTPESNRKLIQNLEHTKHPNLPPYTSIGLGDCKKNHLNVYGILLEIPPAKQAPEFI